MITTTPWPAHNAPAARRSNRRPGFTLVEVMIGAGLSSFILAGVLTAFLFIGRSGANIQNYSEMETQARRALEQFAQDTRQASAITWNSAESVELLVDGNRVTYTYAAGSFKRTLVIATTPPSTTTLTILSGISSFAFKAYNIGGDPIKNIGTTTPLAEASKSTKQLQISLQASRSSKTVSTATNTVLSARFILRNKRVTT